jgi:hypothetical protein
VNRFNSSREFANLHKCIVSVVFAVLALAVFSTRVLAEQWQYDDVERVVAVADVHGAYEPMLKALQNAAVVAEDLSWSGGKAHLVIVGDILDRGPDSRQVMDLLMQLEGEALAAGGRVHVLIGNHEAMNLTGDLRYVSLAEYAAFAEEETREERRHWFRRYSQLRSFASGGSRGTRVQFEQNFPAGFFAYRRAFASDGKYGAWLLKKPLVVVINGTAFVHGGLSQMIADIGLDGVNGRMRDDLAEYVRQSEFLVEAGVLLPTDSFHDHPKLVSNHKARDDDPAGLQIAKQALLRLFTSDVHALNGPLWYRGNVMCSERVEEHKLNRVLEAIGADRVVIGHTPTPGRRVLQRIDGRIIEIDTGMLNNYYGGSANVLTIDSNGILIVNQDAEKTSVPEPHPRRVGSRPGRRIYVETLEELLRDGEIVSRRRKDAFGRQRLSIRHGDISIDATFTRRPASGVFPDVAAYRLDRLLNLDMVPATVVREVDGVEGSVQFTPADSIDEFQRRKKEGSAAAWCPLPEQWDAMFVFDALIYNDQRDGRSILYDPDTWQLLLTVHNKTFANRDGVPGKLKTVELKVDPAWKEELAGLNDAVLQQHLGDVLDEKRLQALGKRRDGLIAAD